MGAVDVSARFGEGGGELIGGRYEVVAHLGKGGMGAVYRAVDRATGEEIAVKRILAEDAGDSAAVVQFQREFHSIARLEHPHIVRVFDYGVDDAGPYYTMEILDGQDLRDLERPTPSRACRLLRDVASALAFLHSRRLLHRDLAPRNVRCTGAGDAKLIDFGLLATFGLSDDVAGTPPLIAPETVRGLPLDQRVDLFGLGGLAYWLLTGRYAFPARAIREVEALWRARPLPPSATTPDVPEALDELVMSLLCIDPLGRPRSAAEVADRLTAIGRLDPPEVDVTGGYVASAALVGRSSEINRMRRRIGDAVAGRGGVIAVQAPSGVGKSRLLRESLLEAQLAGATVVSVSSESAGRGPYGLFRELARRLLATARTDAVDAARPDAQLMASVIPDLSEALASERAASDDGGITDPAEVRLRTQAALNRWLLRIADKRPLVLLVDDVQRGDEASLAVLVGLAHASARRAVLLVVALRSDEKPRFPEVVATLLDAGERIKLRGLSVSDTEALATALFGDVPRVGSLARWMHETTGGSPLHLIEVAHYLVAAEIVSYHDGMWVLPAQSVEIEAPVGLKGAMDARVALLDPAARRLAEALAMHGGPFDLELALRLADSDEPGELFALVDELMEQQILVGTGDSFRIRHDGLREALLRGLSEERETTLHLRIAAVLSEPGPIAVEREADVGWHFLFGGDVERGAELLERAGRRLFEAQAMRDALAPLDAAIETYKQRGDDPSEYRDLLYMIVMAGAISDRHVARRYLEETLEVYQRRSGIALAVRLGRFLGRHLALVIAVLVSAVRGFFSRDRGQGPLQALSRYLMISAHGCYIHYAANDIDGLRDTLRWVAPMNAFKGRAPHGAYVSQHAMLDLMLGRLEQCVDKFRYGVEVVQTDKITPTTDFERRYIEAAGRGFAVVGGLLQLDPGIDAELERIRALDLRYFDFCARAGVALRHRLRGEEQQARAVAEEVEVIGLQLGAGWHIEVLSVTVSSYAYALTHDILGLKRCVEELQRLDDSGHCLGAQLELVRGEYHRERAELDLAEEALARALERRDSEETSIRQWALAARAEVHLARGEVDDAVRTAGEVLALSEDPATALLLPGLRATRTLALAAAARGDHEAARERLDRALAAIEPFDNPVLACMFHEAHARVALLRGDRQACDEHSVEVAHAVNPTRNPALIATSERLRESLRPRAGDAESPDVASEDAITAVTKEAVTSAGRGGSSLLSGCRGRAARSERALELLLFASNGKSGYLFASRDRDVVLCAPTYGDPRDELVARVRELLADEPGARRVDAVEVEARTWHVSVMTATVGNRERVVGALAIESGGSRYLPPDALMVRQLSRELYEAGDVTAIGTRAVRDDSA